MAIWYLDPTSGSDSNAGTSWGLAWKSFGGPSGHAISNNDVIRIAKTPDPVDIGQTATWNSGAYGSNLWKTSSTLAITSSTNANPIVITATAHTLVSGDYVGISGHTTNTNANGVWQITYISANTFSIPITGNGVGGATGAIYKLSNQMITLSSPVTSVISNCDTTWTAGTSCTVSVNTNTNSKEGNGSANFVTSSPATTTKLAYILTTNTNYSSYNQVSFWIYNSTAYTAGQYTLNLCSDTVGATTVNTIAIPAIPSTGQWVAFTVDTGSALGSSIQSVALYTGSTTAPTNTLRIDHIIACGPSSNASSISLTSLLGVNDGVQGWFNIRSINGTAINLDHGVNSNWLSSRGYYGTTTTSELWRRETFKQPMGASTTSCNNTFATSTPLTWSGGWNMATNLQDGTGNGANQTYWDGQNGWGSAFTGPSFSGNGQNTTLTGMSFNRFYSIMNNNSYSSMTSSSYSIFNITNIGNVGTFLTVTGTITISNISFATADPVFDIRNSTLTLNITNFFSGMGSTFTTNYANNTYNIVNLASFQNNGFATLYTNTTYTGTIITGCGATAIGITSSSCNVTVPTITNCGTGVNITVMPSTASISTISGCTTGLAIAGINPPTVSSPAGSISTISGCTTGLSLGTSSNTLIKNMTFSGNTTDIVLSSNTGANYFIDSTYSVAPTISGSVDERFFIRNPNSTVQALCYSDNMVCNTDTTTYHTSGNRSWKIATSRTNTNYPATLNLGYVILQGGATNIITAWVYYTTAGMTCGLRILANQIEGMTSNALATVTGTINTWTQVTLTILSATQSGPVMLQAYGVSSSGTQSMWVADVAVT
jgi:hypothetical protein